MIDLSAEARLEIVQLVYRRWAEEFDLLKRVKKEKPDGEPDWLLMHETRLRHHTASEKKWKDILEEVKPYSPLYGAGLV